MLSEWTTQRINRTMSRSSRTITLSQEPFSPFFVPNHYPRSQPLPDPPHSTTDATSDFPVRYAKSGPMSKEENPARIFPDIFAQAAKRHPDVVGIVFDHNTRHSDVEFVIIIHDDVVL